MLDLIKYIFNFSNIKDSSQFKPDKIKKYKKSRTNTCICNQGDTMGHCFIHNTTWM